MKALITTASGKKGGRNTEMEVTTRAWDEWPQNQLQVVLCKDRWMMRTVTVVMP